MAMGIFEQLDWLTKKVKALCCQTPSQLPRFQNEAQAKNAGLGIGDAYVNEETGAVLVIVK
jgi:hypothetical protein